MISNYLKVLYRNITRHKLYSSINIIGLTAGMSFALVIAMFTWTELQVNKGLKNVDRLYFAESIYNDNNGNPWFTPAPLFETARQQYPGLIDGYYRFLDRNITLSKGEKHFRIQSMIGDSSFIELFGFKVLSGNAGQSLSRPNTIVISEKVAQQFFGRTDVAGETLSVATEGYGNKYLDITAVIETPERKNSVTDFVNMDAQVFLPMSSTTYFSLGTPDLDQWPVTMISYVKLSQNVDITKFESLLNSLHRKNVPQDVTQIPTIVLKPLIDYYLMTNHGAVKNLLITLNIMVIFILALAISNFINITISGSFSRLKEIGVRKVIGGVKHQVRIQFLSESLMFALTSGMFSLLLYEIVRGYAGSTLNTELPSVVSFPPLFWLAITVATTTVGLIAGAYPAWYLSATHTLESLKGKFKSVKGTVNFSRSLIAVQFSISIFILTGALIMSRQITFFLDKDLGYDKSAVLVVTSAPRLWTPEGYERMEAAKRDFLRSPVIMSMSLSTGTPAGMFSMGGAIVYQSGKSVQEGINATLSGTDEDFAKVHGMTMADGNYFSDAGKFQPNCVVINETLQKKLLVQTGDKVKLDGAGDTEFSVVGIIKDFNTESLRDAVQPVVIQHNRDYMTFRHYSIKLKPGNLKDAVAEVERNWRRIFPDDAFSYTFADERITLLYKTEMQMNQAAKLASWLMMIIVMTGVLGLVALSVARRSKEIGIRKVLGASAQSILRLLSLEYVMIMLISFIVAIPLSYWFVSDWLNSFVYHINLTFWMFAAPIGILFMVTLVMICIQGMNAAFSDPVKSIRHE